MSTLQGASEATGKAHEEIDIFRDEAFFLAHEHDLMRDYPDKYVAVRGERIVGVAGSLREMQDKLYRRYNDHVYAFVRRVCPESFAPPGDPTILIF